MPMPTNLASYADAREIMDRAMNSERGISFPMESPARAKYMIQRLNMFRALDREEVKRLYVVSDPRGATSMYDLLRIAQEKEKVIITKHPSVEALEITEL